MGRLTLSRYGVLFVHPHLLSYNNGQALTTAFSQLLSQLIYSQEELRPAILKALKTMVDSNVALASGSDESERSSRIEHISKKAAQENVAFLKTQADSWLAVLFNVFGTVDREVRGKIGDVIRVWASIAKPEVCSFATCCLLRAHTFIAYFESVCQGVAITQAKPSHPDCDPVQAWDQCR